MPQFDAQTLQQLRICRGAPGGHARNWLDEDLEIRYTITYIRI